MGKRVPPAEGEDHGPVPGGRPSASPAAGAAVRLAFESLVPLQRSALELAHTSGMPVGDIARALDLTVAEVRTALRDGLLNLAGVSKGRASA
jgi:DNA-directed RNA polymerase specialized sigma24 family protein